MPWREVYFTPTGTWQRCITANADRVAIGFFPDTIGSSIKVSTKAGTATTGGLFLLNTGVTWFTFHDCGPLVGSEWWCFTSGFATQLGIFEVVFSPIQ